MDNTHNLLTKHDLDYAEVKEADEEWNEPLQLGMGSAFNCPEMSQCNIPMSKTGHGRTIIHLDIDCFYAQVEMLQNPELRNKPLGIQQKNIVVTTNYVARNCGVPKSALVTEAKKICPQLVLVCGEDLSNYRLVSYKISEFLKKFTALVERLGFDENYLDVSKLVTTRLENRQYRPEFMGHIYGFNQQGNKQLCSCGCELRLQIGSQIAAEIREALNNELGITCCAGVSYNKLLAKLVAGKHKPNQQTTLLPNLALEFMSSLPSVFSIPGIGFTTNRVLNSLGIESVLDLQSSNKKMLEKEFGPTLSEMMLQLSFGIDDSPVTAYSQPQTLSDEDSFKCCNEVADVEHRIRKLLMSLLNRVVEDGRVPQTVRLTVRKVFNKYHRETRQSPIPGHIFNKFVQSYSSEAAVEQLMPVLMRLFHKLVDTSHAFHLTLLSICFAKLTKPAGEHGCINSFFTKGETYPSRVSDTLELKQQVKDKRSIFKSSIKAGINFKSPSIKYEVKSQRTVKTMKDFLYRADNGTQSTRLLNVGTVDGSESKLSFNVSLPLIDGKSVSTASTAHGKSVNSAFTDNPNDFSKAFTINKQDKCLNSVESKQMLTAAVKESYKSKLAENIHGLSKECFPDGYFTGTLNIKFLQKLLPSHVDVQMITELPLDIQKEVLLEYGLNVKNLAQGQLSTVCNKSLRTKNISNKEIDTVQIYQPSLRKKSTAKRNSQPSLLVSENDGSISKKRKVELNVEPRHNLEISQHLGLKGSKVENHCADIYSESTCCEMNELPRWVSIRDIQSQDHILLSTNCCLAEANADDTAVVDSSKSSYEILSSFSKNVPVFPAEKFDDYTSSCEISNKDTSIPIVSSHLDQYKFASHKPSVQMPDKQGSLDLLVTKSISTLMQSDRGTSILTKSDRRTSTFPQSDRGASTFSQSHGQIKVSNNKLPGNIDSEVFSSLPRNIRGEIMAHFMMGGSESATGHFVVSEPKKNVKNIKNKNHNTLLTYFKKK